MLMEACQKDNDRMFRKKSDGMHHRFADSSAAQAKSAGNTRNKCRSGILLSLAAIVIISGCIAFIRSCNCGSSPEVKTPPRNESISVQKNTRRKLPAVQGIEATIITDPEPDKNQPAEKQESPPEKHEPKIIDLGTHVEIVTP
jgi:hypothetical protein